MDKYGNFYSDSDLLFGSPLPFSESSFGKIGDFFSEREIILASDSPKKRAGRKKFRETFRPAYRGVRLRDSGKWVCELREPNKKSRIWLGTYATAEMVARAHDLAAITLRGRSACLNFADSTWRLSLPASLNTKDIQKAAADAFSPRSDEFDQEAAEEVAEEIPLHSAESTRETEVIGEAFHRQSAEEAAVANVFWMEGKLYLGWIG